ncbi:MAG TPA: glycosyltransferase [Solirubrobacteraceae bacterium]|nr:glycosyltransferase [Solirubrobacteraceae bacterium]
MPARPVAERRIGRGAARDGHPRREHRPLGPRRRHRALLAAAPRPEPAARRDHGALRRQIDPGEGADLLADTFLRAHAADPRLHLALAGGGPEEHLLRERLGEHATFLGWLEGDALAAAYASADIFLFASRTDTFGQVLLEAQASGLPVVAVGEGGPTSIVTDGATGRLCPADAGALAEAVTQLAAQPLQRERLANTALQSVALRTWERSLQRLADGYRRALEPTAAIREVSRAA